MVIAADYPFLDILWTMIIFFAWVVYIWMIIVIFGDLFSRHDISGWGKAAWTILAIVLPYIGVLAYLITQGSHMAERRAEKAAAAQGEMDQYVRRVAHTNGATEQIAKAKELLDSGAINQAEFDRIKQKALA